MNNDHTQTPETPEAEAHLVLVERVVRALTKLIHGQKLYAENNPRLAQFRDEFGTELTLRIEDRSGGTKHVFARLVRPILPGEVVRFTSEILFREHMPDDDGTLTYRSVGNYPDDRLVSKMLKLPAGATIAHVSPEPAQQFDVDGVPFVYWRRYYKAGEETPLEVAFRVE